MHLFGEQRVSPEVAIAKLEEIKRAITGIPGPEPQENSLAGLCIVGKTAFLRHADDPDGVCKRCGAKSEMLRKQPRFLPSRDSGA